MANKRVTQIDVAKAAGVHRTTVSLSFKKHPSIPAATREKVLKIAKKMGYTPDPMLSALASYRNRLQDRKYQGTLAWLLVDDEKANHLGEPVGFPYIYYVGAKERAREHGYEVQTFEYDSKQTTVNRMASILRARNVNGVLLSPQNKPYTVMDFNWDDFSFISFGYTLHSPKLHIVTSAQYRSTVRLLDKMHQMGYRRIAFVFDPVHDARVDHNFMAGYLVHRQGLGLEPIIYPYRWKDLGGEKFINFIKDEQVDGVISGDPNTVDYARALGIKVPQQLGMACPAIARKHSPMTGFDEAPEQVGAVAVDRLIDMINRGEKGIPTTAHCTLVDGVWVEAHTM